MYCYNCGEKIDERERFCSNCGADLADEEYRDPEAAVNEGGEQTVSDNAEAFSTSSKSEKNGKIKLKTSTIIIVALLALVAGGLSAFFMSGIQIKIIY